MDEREIDPRLDHQGTRVLQLAIRQIETHRSGARLRQGDRPLGGAAAEFEDILVADIAKDAQVGFRDLPDAPRHPTARFEQRAVPVLV